MSAQLSAYIYHYGLKAGLPFPMLRGTAGLIDAAPRLPDYLRRKRVAQDAAAGSEWADFLPQDLAFRAFEAGQIPSLVGLTELGGALYERHRDVNEVEREAAGKSPISHLIGHATQDELAEIARLATNPDIAAIMCGYFGSVPRFDNADIWISRPNKSAVGSQLFHLDKPDRRYTSIFLNLRAVTEENGPFVMLNKPDSDIVRDRTAYEKNYYHRDGRLADSEIDRIGMRDRAIALTGEAGAGGIVDTSECLHCGSRVSTGERVVMILSFMHAHKPGIARFDCFADDYQSDEVRRLMLGR
jgi:hypothetical protein